MNANAPSHRAWVRGSFRVHRIDRLLSVRSEESLFPARERLAGMRWRRSPSGDRRLYLSVMARAIGRVAPGRRNVAAGPQSEQSLHEAADSPGTVHPRASAAG